MMGRKDGQAQKQMDKKLTDGGKMGQTEENCAESARGDGHGSSS